MSPIMIRVFKHKINKNRLQMRNKSMPINYLLTINFSIPGCIPMDQLISKCVKSAKRICKITTVFCEVNALFTTILGFQILFSSFAGPWSSMCQKFA